MSNHLFYTTQDTPIGKVLLVASAKGLRKISLLESNEDVAATIANRYGEALPTHLPGFFDTSCQAIQAYLTQGAPLHLPADLAQGTPLQRMVWIALSRIPYGQTISYSELAERVGFPRAVRAVASACGANPVPLALPCHRVIAKDGTLGGFSLGGLEVKEKLLALESEHLARLAA